jgi:hypothetical protein
MQRPLRNFFEVRGKEAERKRKGVVFLEARKVRL